MANTFAKLSNLTDKELIEKMEFDREINKEKIQTRIDVLEKKHQITTEHLLASIESTDEGDIKDSDTLEWLWLLHALEILGCNDE